MPWPTLTSRAMIFADHLVFELSMAAALEDDDREYAGETRDLHVYDIERQVRRADRRGLPLIADYPRA